MTIKYIFPASTSQSYLNSNVHLTSLLNLWQAPQEIGSKIGFLIYTLTMLLYSFLFQKNNTQLIKQNEILRLSFLFTPNIYQQFWMVSPECNSNYSLYLHCYHLAQGIILSCTDYWNNVELMSCFHSHSLLIQLLHSDQWNLLKCNPGTSRLRWLTIYF